MSKRYLVTEIKKEDKNKVKLKALKYGLSIDELIVKSIESFNEDVICQCHKARVKEVTYHHAIDVSGVKVNAIVDNVPTMTCKSCDDDALFDLELISLLNNLIEPLMLDGFIESKRKKTQFNFDYKLIESIN